MSTACDAARSRAIHESYAVSIVTFGPLRLRAWMSGTRRILGPFTGDALLNSRASENLGELLRFRMRQASALGERYCLQTGCGIQFAYALRGFAQSHKMLYDCAQVAAAYGPCKGGRRPGIQNIARALLDQRTQGG